MGEGWRTQAGGAPSSECGGVDTLIKRSLILLVAVQ